MCFSKSLSLGDDGIETVRTYFGVGFSRTEFENGIKDAPAGQKFYRTITDDTQPGGPVQRTIEYVAPFRPLRPGGGL